ncbi:DNA-binding response regulator [Virgibacillus profundi]|uniref:DNA-binding response regulator n=1 Tax=Virgibacillus profundi TaxID=2024555 RepID=A0A2A2I9N9_9BACI|nr:response regulator transcription factor [Virgibacillus profundi]PAV28292.1 DNA-binding response regulator [Virgibacillus profundi]PXY52596.1 DNA-binding response regulator [Virgibacillus profundi]
MEQQVNILVVEDDNDINQLLCKIIKRSNYFPQPAYSGTEALIYLEKQDWDLVLLDLMLPGMSGEEVLTKITSQSTVPVIIISAKGKQQSKINSLRAGADDYITKPFDIEEVSARIDSHLRRYKRTSEPPDRKELTHKDIVVDLEAKTVWVNGTELTLTVREYSILVLLMSSPKKVFTKSNLFESVWNEQFHGDDNTVNVHMSNLRTKLSKANPEEEYIETIWGMGYRIKS